MWASQPLGHATRFALAASLSLLAVASKTDDSAGGGPLAPRAHIAQAAALAQPADIPLTVDRWGGATTGVVVDGDWAYVAVGSSLATVDVSDPAAMVELNRSAPERDVLQYLHIAQDHVLAIGRTIGLVAFDVADAVRPTAVGRFGVLGTARDLAVTGTTAYLCDTKAGLRILDVADPRAPQLIGEWLPPDGFTAARVAVEGNLAYLLLWSPPPAGEVFTIAGPESRLVVLDMADPAQPAVIGGLSLPFETYPWDVAVKGGGLFLGSARGLITVDATDPVHPSLVGTANWGHALQVEVTGDILWAYSQQEITLHDVSRPDAVRTLPTLPFTALKVLYRDSITTVAASGPTAFLATGPTLEAFDIAQPFVDPTLGELTLAPSAADESVDVAAVGHHLLVAADSRGLRVVDGTDPAAPVEVASLPPVAGQTGRMPAVRHVAVAGDTAYLTEAGLGGGLRTVDVSDPAAPAVLGQITRPGLAGRPVVLGNLVLVPVLGSDDASNGLSIVDVSSPDAPHEVGWLAVDSEVRGVAASGNVAVVASDGLIVVDLTDPTAPRRRGTASSPPLWTGIATDGRWAYASLRSSGGLAVFDLANPDLPALTQRLMYLETSPDLRLDGNTLLVPALRQIALLDVAQRSRPRVTKAWRIPEVLGSRAMTAVDGVLWYVDTMRTVRALDAAAPSGLRTLGEMPFEGQVTGADIDGDRVAALTSYSWRRPLLTVFGGGPRASMLGQSITADLQTVARTWGRIALRGDAAWLTGHDPGLAAFDIGDPAAIRRLTPSSPYVWDNTYLWFETEAERAYFHLGFSHPSQIGIVDLSDPSAPRQLGAVTMQWWGLPFAADGRTLWCLKHAADSETVIDRLTAIDVTDPTAPREIASYPIQIERGPHGDILMAAEDGTLILSNGEDGIQIWDVSSPTAARSAGRLDLRGFVFNVAIDDGLAWAQVHADRLRIAVIDVSDPDAPDEIASIDMADHDGGAMVRASGRAAAIANMAGGLFVVRVGRPGDPPADATPQLIGRGTGGLPTPHPAIPPPTSLPTPTDGARPTVIPPPAPRPLPIYLPINARHVRLSGPPSHIVVALDRSAAMAALLVGRPPGAADSTRGTRFGAARALAESLAAAPATTHDGPTVSVVTYDRQAERLALRAGGGLEALRRWLDARPPTTAAAARHDVALAAASADIASVAPSGCAFVALVTSAGASGDEAADRDAADRAAALRAAGVRTMAVDVGDDAAGPGLERGIERGDGASDRAWLADLVGGSADVRPLAAAEDAAALAETLLALAAGCVR